MRNNTEVSDVVHKYLECSIMEREHEKQSPHKKYRDYRRAYISLRCFGNDFSFFVSSRPHAFFFFGATLFALK